MILMTIWEISHVVLLYTPPLVAIAYSARTWKRRGDLPTPDREVLRTLWPFVVIAILESWIMNNDGRLVAEWIVPGLTALFIASASREVDVRRRCRKWLIWTSIVMVFSGSLLREYDHPTDRDYRRKGQHAEWSWMTPANGMRKMVPDSP